MAKHILRKLRLLTVILVIMSCSSCSTRAKANDYSYTASPKSEVLITAAGNQYFSVAALIDDIIKYGRKFLGKPYRYRGPSNWPMDCSGYVSHIFSQFGIDIPRSSAALSNYTLNTKEPQVGDLLFFKGRNSRSSRVGHVALLIDIKGDDLIMMHSTNNRGIIVETLSRSQYFNKRYLGAGRLPQIQRLQRESSPNGSYTPIPFRIEPLEISMPNFQSTLESFAELTAQAS